MLPALVLWLFALYGCIVLVFQCVQKLRQGRGRRSPSTLVFVVRDAAEEIEGALRTLAVAAALGRGRGQIVVIDFGSQDDTGCIVRKMAAGNPLLSYRWAATEQECSEILAEVCLRPAGPTWVWDTRGCHPFRQVIQEAVWACR
ncbi:MAG: hypothetical protein IRZ33_07025 [Alicyclobacillaceae bacterium]|nr:hypothetical protein [Alicyclobacillaceae bacterium]